MAITANSSSVLQDCSTRSPADFLDLCLSSPLYLLTAANVHERPALSNANALRARVRDFAIRILKFVRILPRDPAAETIARQLARAGTGISSNYHSSGRARSRAEFIARLAIVLDEADESQHWLFIAQECGVASGSELQALLKESAELRAIFSKALATARLNKPR